VRVRFRTVDVFTERPFAGNQLAVVLDAEVLSTEQMQEIAAEFNYSETSFVLPPEAPDHEARIRIFTPKSEVPFAGHPTIGAAAVLGWEGSVSLGAGSATVILEEQVGEVPVTVSQRSDGVIFAQLTAAQLPKSGPNPPSREELAAVVSLSPDDLCEGEHFPQTWTCGLPFLFIPVKSLEATERARIDHDHWKQTLADFWSAEPYVFTTETVNPEAHVHARLFAPGLGVGEDPATGSAAAALAGYLAERNPQASGVQNWIIEQGLEMGRPSRLELQLHWHDTTLQLVQVGGSSVLVSSGELNLPG